MTSKEALDRLDNFMPNPDENWYRYNEFVKMTSIIYEDLEMLEILKKYIVENSNAIETVYKDCSKEKLQLKDGVMINKEDLLKIKEWLENDK